MPKFETPEPIAVTVELSVADVRITASDRRDTLVEVRPSDDADDSDVKAAQQVQVDYANGVLRIIGPKRLFDFSRKARSVEVSIELPSGSQLSADLQVGGYRCAGRLGECRVKVSAGNVWLERTGALRVDASAGHITVDDVAGSAEIHTGSGKVQIGDVDGTAVIKNSNGDTTIDAVTGDLRVRNANGDIQIGRADGSVDAKTSNGSIRLGEVNRGVITLATANGNLDVGIAEGTAAWLEVNTGFGHVHNLLNNATGPGQTDQTADIRGRTSYGDITIHRS